MNKQKFINICKDNNFICDKQALANIEQYILLLQQWNEKINLTAIVENEQVYDKHIMDCLFPTFKYPLKGDGVDVGSGAGFPGIVWAIFYPDINITLIEPTLKRCNFLNEVKQQLNLSNVTILNKRSEDCIHLRNSFDFASARAVANLSIICELVLPLLKNNGIFYALKGSKAMQEYQMATNALKILNATLIDTQSYICEDSGTHITLYIKKLRDIEKKYPRNYAQIKKKPL